MSSILCCCWNRQSSGKEFSVVNSEQTDEGQSLKPIVTEDQRRKDEAAVAGGEELCSTTSSDTDQDDINSCIQRAYIPAGNCIVTDEDTESDPHLIEFLAQRQLLLNKREDIYDEILQIINNDRRSYDSPDLSLCPELNLRAKELWAAQSNKPDGFVVIPNNMVLHQRGDKFQEYGCLTYFTPRMDLLAKSIVEFWVNAGEPEDSPRGFQCPGESYVHPRSPLYAEFLKQSNNFKAQLISYECQSIGLHIDMAQAVPADTCNKVMNTKIAKENLICVIAIFDAPSHVKTAKEIDAAEALIEDKLMSNMAATNNPISIFH